MIKFQKEKNIISSFIRNLTLLLRVYRCKSEMQQIEIQFTLKFSLHFFLNLSLLAESLFGSVSKTADGKVESAKALTARFIIYSKDREDESKVCNLEN